MKWLSKPVVSSYYGNRHSALGGVVGPFLNFSRVIHSRASVSRPRCSGRFLGVCPVTPTQLWFVPNPSLTPGNHNLVH